MYVCTHIATNTCEHTHTPDPGYPHPTQGGEPKGGENTPIHKTESCLVCSAVLRMMCPLAEVVGKE